MSPVPTKPVLLRPADVEGTPSSSFDEPSRGNTTWRTLLSAPNTPTTSLSAGIAVCPSKGSLALHRHKQAEIYYIMSGTGEIEINGQRHRVSKDMTIWIPGDAEHGVFCTEGEELKWLYIFPEGNFENVVYRFSGEQGETSSRKGKQSKL